MTLRKTWLAWAAAAAVWALTIPSNRTEAEDAYYYARMVEQGAGRELFHAHHLLYLPLGRLLFRAAQTAGYSGRSLPALAGWSLFSGLLSAWLLAASLRTGRRAARAVAPDNGCIWGLGLLFSYGFWRYGLEAEIYVPAVALMLLAWYCAQRAAEHPRWFWGGAASAAAALLLHLAALPAVLLAVPALYFFRREYRRALGHAALTLALVGGVYAVVAAGPGWGVFRDAGVARDASFSVAALWKGAAALGHNFLSGNFLFGLPAVAGRMEQAYPGRFLAEEIFMGRMASLWVGRLAPLTFLLGGLCLPAMFIVALRTRGVDRAGRWAAGLWFLGAAGVALATEPANPEMWIPALPAFWLWLGSSRPATATTVWRRRLPVALVAALLLHNAVGGLWPLRSPAGDYARQKAAGALNVARAGDVILTADSHSLVTYLEYYSPARIADGRYVGAAEWTHLLRTATGRAFVFHDVIAPPAPLLRRDPESVARLRNLGETARPGLTPAWRDAFGGGYVYKPPAPREVGAP